jgi:FAD/FMN-containing dehydrogenase
MHFPQALMIDLRDISYVKINETKTSAKVGGGILMGKLGKELSNHELASAIGTISFVGYTGWATYGGYGSFSSSYGLGVDNIVGAKVINWKGKVVDADEKMLKVIRGAGGFVGIIAELTIKTYPLKSVSFYRS